MGKDKTKTRLDKAGNRVEFIGFGAFDAAASTAPDGAAATNPSSFSSSAQPVSSWTPVYYGSESEIRLLFPRISQKKDATTKVKALRELAAYFHNADVPKKLQAETLAHFAWLYHHKLAYDLQPTVRAESLAVWKAAADRIPKACKTLMEYYPELCGMLYCAQSDSDAQVAMQYRNTMASVYEQTAHDWPWQDGLLEYAHRILSYGRPSSMHQALFAATKKQHHDETAPSSSTQQQQQQINEQQRDELEERFERIVGTALAALEVYVREQGGTTLTLNESQDVWFLTLTSPKPSLRYKTYQLLGTCLLKNQEQLLPKDIATTLVQKVMSSEREANIVPMLLETLLVFLSKQRQHAAAFQKPLQKMLAKACYGARVSAWGPTILPLLSFFDSNKLALLNALQEGRPLGAVDTWQLQQVVVECSAFALLQRKSNADVNEYAVDEAKKVGQVWLKAFYGTLLTPISLLPPAVQTAHGAVVQELARSLLRFQDACAQRPDCDIYLVQDWFWTDGLKVDANTTDPLVVAQLVAAARTCSSTPKEPSLILPVVKPYFTGVLEKYQGSSGSVPNEGAYRVVLEVLQFFGPMAIFDEQSLKRFVMNDLLRWIVIHTSTLSVQEQNDTLVDYDFGLLAVCLRGFGDKAIAMWQSVLTEIVAAKCSIRLLNAGLMKLLPLEGTVNWISCSVFDRFALGFGLRSLDGDNTATEDVAELQFLQLCMGLVGYPALVSDEVVSTWIDRACLQLDASSADLHMTSRALVHALVELVAQRKTTLSAENIDRILLTSWYYGGDFFERTTVRVLLELPASQQFTTNASNYLAQELKVLCESSEDSSRPRTCTSRQWSEQAWRFVAACQSLSAADSEWLPSLKLFGLTDPDLWRRYPDVLFSSAVSFFEGFKTSKERTDLLERSCDDSAEFLASVLVSLSQASFDAYQATIVKAAKDRAGMFLSCLGGDNLDAGFLESLVQALVAQALVIQLPGGVDTLRRCAAVIAQVLRLLLGPIGVALDENVDPATVKEGMELWYITDTARPDDRSRVDVVKVHYDAQVGYYFSIRFGSQERQTVAERLRCVPATSTVDKLQTGSRKVIAASLVKLIRTHFDLKSPEPVVGELINILCNVDGLDKARGIGSDHYELVSNLASLESDVVSSLERDDTDDLSTALWTVACARGFGINVPTSGFVRSTLPFDPKLMLTALSQFYDRHATGVSLDLDEAVVAWLTMAVNAIENDEVALTMSLTLLFDRILFIADQADENGFSHQDVVVSSAILTALQVASSRETDPDLIKAAINAIQKWVFNFAVFWEGGDTAPSWTVHSDFPRVVKLVQENACIQDLFLQACDGSILELLSAALFCEWKRHFSFVLLQMVGGSGKPWFEGMTVNPETTSRLREWTAGFQPEEAEVIEEDVEIVSRWLPRKIMGEIEHWGAEIIEDTDDPTTVARLLMWLCVLRYVDVCSPKDFRFRPAFLSYLNQSGAANAALNLAVLNDEAINSDDARAPALLDVDVLLHDAALFHVPELASLILFQTVEVLPSLSRKWFDDSCPKAYIADVLAFVERYVSPEILLRELSRVRAPNSGFGTMGVSASASRREVKAAYLQDDFTLSVLIMLPAAFPFRSAEVDCSKTVGVPADRLKRWSLQIRTMLNNQGGTLQDALMLWKENVDKEFEGVEPCPVCYSVLHAKTHKLPALKCKICSNRFHFDCLNQWFRSSGKNQCVLCQQPWQGTHV